MSEVANGSLENSIFNMKLNDVNGSFLEAQMILDNNGAFLSLPNGIKIPLYDPTSADIQASKPNEVTYRQLMDAMSIAPITAILTPPSTNKSAITPLQKKARSALLNC